jgi:hypothetical protein
MRWTNPTAPASWVVIILWTTGASIFSFCFKGLGWILLFSVSVHFLFIVWVVSSIPQQNQVRSPARPRVRGYTPRPTNAGHWVEAPIAEVDKSTMGQLLASRMRREPGLHVVVRSPSSAPEPIRLDALYDAELDG